MRGQAAQQLLHLPRDEGGWLDQPRIRARSSRKGWWPISLPSPRSRLQLQVEEEPSVRPLAAGLAAIASAVALLGMPMEASAVSGEEPAQPACAAGRQQAGCGRRTHPCAQPW